MEGYEVRRICAGLAGVGVATSAHHPSQRCMPASPLGAMAHSHAAAAGLLGASSSRGGRAQGSSSAAARCHPPRPPQTAAAACILTLLDPASGSDVAGLELATCWVDATQAASPTHATTT